MDLRDKFSDAGPDRRCVAWRKRRPACRRNHASGAHKGRSKQSTPPAPGWTEIITSAEPHALDPAGQLAARLPLLK